MAVKFEKVGNGAFMLDVQGYVCPHPQLYTKKALEKLASGDTLELLFDNPSSGESIIAMCEAEGNQILSQILSRNQSGGKAMRWTIRKA